MRLILYYNYKNPFIDYNAVINEITKLTCLYVHISNCNNWGTNYSIKRNLESLI